MSKQKFSVIGAARRLCPCLAQCIFLSGAFQNLRGCVPVWPALDDPALARGLESVISGGPFRPLTLLSCSEAEDKLEASPSVYFQFGRSLCIW